MGIFCSLYPSISWQSHIPNYNVYWNKLLENVGINTFKIEKRKIIYWDIDLKSFSMCLFKWEFPVIICSFKNYITIPLYNSFCFSRYFEDTDRILCWKSKTTLFQFLAHELISLIWQPCFTKHFWRVQLTLSSIQNNVYKFKYFLFLFTIILSFFCVFVNNNIYSTVLYYNDEFTNNWQKE